MSGTVIKSLIKRWRGHVYKATVKRAPFTLSKSIRKYGEDAFDVESLWIVRGKVAAFSVEAEIINDEQPLLNERKRAI